MNTRILLGMMLLCGATLPAIATDCDTGPCTVGEGIHAWYVTQQSITVGISQSFTLQVGASDTDSCGDPTPCQDVVTYQWIDAGTSSSASSVTTSFSVPGQYTVKCRVDDVHAGFLGWDPWVDVVFDVNVVVPTYSADPPITAEIAMDNANPMPGDVVELHVTDGDDFLAYDKDTKWIGGINSGTVDDDLSLAKWTVTGGTLDVAETSDWLHGFRAHWTVPNTAGVYTVTLKVYDAAKYGASSRDSVDPNPYTRTKTFSVGAVTHVADPPITAAIGAPNYIAPGTQATVATSAQVHLKALDGSTNNPAYDKDSMAVAGVFTSDVDDEIVAVEWHVTDSQGRAVGTLASTSGMDVVWTAPMAAQACWITMTINDKAANGQEYDDRPRTLTAQIRVGGAPADAPALTKTSAIAAARTFCGNIGPSETSAAEAHFPALVDYNGARPTYYAPRWDVKFESGTEVQVVDSASPVIARYTNFKATEDLLALDPLYQGAGTAIEEAVAISTADDARQETLSIDTVAGPTASLHQMTDPPLAAGQTWTVTWPREHFDILAGSMPYRDQAARVVLQGETGAVQGLSLTFPTTEPVPALNDLIQTYALVVAEDQLAAANIDTPVLQGAALMAVEPNTLWSGWPSGSSEPMDGPPVVAWNCIYTAADSVTYEVWVSAAGTGSVVGGEVWAVARGTSAVRAKAKPGAAAKAVMKKPTAKPSQAAVKKTTARPSKPILKKVIHKSASKRDGRRAHQ